MRKRIWPILVGAMVLPLVFFACAEKTTEKQGKPLQTIRPWIHDADTLIRVGDTFWVSKHINVRWTTEKLIISIDSSNLGEIELGVGFKMATYFSFEHYIIMDGRRSLVAYGGTSSKRAEFHYSHNLLELDKTVNGIDSYEFELIVKITESDDPNIPRIHKDSRHYQVIWQDTLTAGTFGGEKAGWPTF